jgi:uracil-DNA glycosylase family 4
VLAGEIAACRACPRLVAHREAIGREKRRAYRAETYWAKPVPGFGDPAARLVIVGLAPGAHGANRTGRPFTGDRSGDFLYAALHRAGLASQAESVSRGDGLRLEDAFITMPCRCAPPDNRPDQAELDRCRDWFVRELALLAEVRALLALGAIAWRAVLDLGAAERVPFSHGAEARVVLPWSRRDVAAIASYHVSQQNTQTGRLGPAMFDAVLRRSLAAATGRRAAEEPARSGPAEAKARDSR